ncbi:PTS glucose transporter subunit IIA [Anaerococcus sp. Marseille-Q7828]|uniref:PTS sugar transporter subunit IIA n=1 Tax=Anaerococcus sp. Marseille-Q7828 TaxID=3036300 RepID=UPI0024AC9368|nr:PTS glucose transporter subunit IIA [Anaerococcus sp. Marseille-Q7828]
MSLFGNLFKKDKENENTNYSNKVLVPITGIVSSVKECQDPVFAGEMVGKGSLILPSEGKVYSPVDGEISMVADSKHALGITSNTGLEILIHIGLDTVELNGEPYTSHVSQGQKVKAGDLLMEFDIKKIKAAGKSVESPVIITNADDKEINLLANGQTNHGEELMEVIG